MKKVILLLITHAFVGVVGFAAGIYVLPILIAPPAPSAEEVRAVAARAQFTGEFRRELQDSDALHWGEGTLAVGPDTIALMGSLAPGPDYKLYLLPEFVETEADFNRLKSTALRVGDVKTFENFVLPVPAGTDLTAYTTVVVWCESFGEFITSAKYR